MGNLLESGGHSSPIFQTVKMMLTRMTMKEQYNDQKQQIPEKVEKQVIVEDIGPKLLQQILQLKKILLQSQNSLQQARIQAVKAHDPKMYKQKKQQVFTAFLNNLQHYKFTEALPKNSRRYHIVIGPISVGKSCLLNKFLHLNLKTGVGETTDKAVVVASNNQVDILDSPGVNEDFSFYDINTLALFHCVDRVFILYRTCLKDIKDILRIMAIIKPDDTYLVRTQCDNFSESDFKNLDQQLMTDRQYAQKVIKHQFTIFATSAKMDQKFADNKIVADLINGKK